MARSDCETVRDLSIRFYFASDWRLIKSLAVLEDEQK